MKRLFMITTAALTALLLGGCATTIRSDVTTFHQWPAQMEDKSYAFQTPPPAENTLEWRAYSDLVRAQLAQLGFKEAAPGNAALTVSMDFTTTAVPVRVVEPIMMAPTYYWHPMPRAAWRHPYRRYWHPVWHSPFYDPFWSPFPQYRVTMDTQYRRELQVSIMSKAQDKRLFDVTVHNTGRQRSTPEIMPALVQSAFANFPGPSGIPRTIELKREN